MGRPVGRRRHVRTISRLETLLAFGEERGADVVSDNILLCPDGDIAFGQPMIPRSLSAGTPAPDGRRIHSAKRRARSNPRVRYGFMHPIMRKDFLSGEGLWYDEHIRFGEDFLLYTQCLVHNANGGCCRSLCIYTACGRIPSRAFRRLTI